MKKITLICLFAFCAGYLLPIQSVAQTIVTTQPRISQKAWVGQQVGLTDMKVVYHRPAVKGREIWGNLVPDEKVWRAGANENTIIYFSDDVKIEGKLLKAGKYGLHLMPAGSEAIVIFSNETTAWGSYSYDPSEDALRVSIKPVKADRHYELLTFQFDGVTENTAVCELAWGMKKFPISIEVDVKEKVLASLREQLKTQAGWTWDGWNEAANYCLQNNIITDEALGWAKRSVFMNPTPQNLMTSASLYGRLAGKGDEAKEKEITISALDKMMKTHPVSWKEYNAAAKYATEVKNYQKGQEWAEQSVQMNPSMTNLMTKAMCMEASGQKDKAETVRKEAISRGSNAELNAYAYKLLFGGKPDEAVQVFEANAKKNPEDPNVWDSLGEGYMTVGKKDKAIENFQKALSMSPPDNVKANSIKNLKQLGVDYAGAGGKP